MTTLEDNLQTELHIRKHMTQIIFQLTKMILKRGTVSMNDVEIINNFTKDLIPHDNNPIPLPREFNKQNPS